MKRILILTAFVLLALGMLTLAGCGKKVAREADVAAGDFYTEEEFNNLGKEQRDRYCADLADQLDQLAGAAEDKNSNLDGLNSQLDDIRRQMAQAQSEIAANADEAQQVQDEINYYESLPTSYSVVRGDCLWNISGKDEIYADPIKWPRLYRANRDAINNPNLIYPGQVFQVPRDWPNQHQVVRGEWLSKIAGYWEVYDNFREWPRLYEANRDQINDANLIHPGQVIDIPR